MRTNRWLLKAATHISCSEMLLVFIVAVLSKSCSAVLQATQHMPYVVEGWIDATHVLGVGLYDFHVWNLLDLVLGTQRLCLVDVYGHKGADMAKLTLQLLKPRLEISARAAPRGAKLAHNRTGHAALQPLEILLRANSAHWG